MGYWHPSDKDFLVPTLKYSAFLLALIRQLPDLVRQHNDEDYSWMWQFFAEPPKDCEEINNFWTQVTDEATAILRANSFSNDESPQKLSSPQKSSTPQKRSPSQKASSPQKSSTPSTPSTPQKISSFQTPYTPQIPSTPQTASSSQKVKRETVSAESARIYLAEEFGADLRSAYGELKKAFKVLTDKDFDVLFIFDEARYLTDTSAIDGKLIPVGAEYQDDSDPQGEKKASE